MSLVKHTHTLDSEGEICSECGLFEDFFENIPECPALDEIDEDEEIEGEEVEEEPK